MATAPQINYFDGNGTTTEMSVTTNLYGLVLTGTVDSNTVDVQIDLNGSGFVSDPTLVGLELSSFTVPNLVSFPSGIQLDKGINTIRLRAIDLSGAVSPISTITVEVVSDIDLFVILSPPTGFSLARYSKTVELSWTDVQASNATGYYVYASTGPGGTGSGYLRINADMIPANSPQETIVYELDNRIKTYDFQDSSSSDLRVFTSTIDPVSGQEIEQKSINTFPLIQSPEYRLTVSVASLQTQKKYTYKHDRYAGPADGVLNNDVFSVTLISDPLYYVVTAVYFDQDTGVLQESRISEELAGFPLVLDQTIRGIQIRDQKAISQSYILELQKKSSKLSLIPGSSVREVHIEPFSNEAQKAYFLADFVHRSKSFTALLAVDDPNLTGTSIPVSSSQYKQSLKTALSINDDSAVQALIDSSFDALAAQYGRSRQAPRQAIVIQTFYTTSRPQKDLFVSQSSVVSSSDNPLAPRFISNSQVNMLVSNIQSYYNADKQRYEVTSQMVAEFAGSVGNVTAGDLDTVVSGAAGFKTENVFSAEFGSDLQSNLSLSEDCLRAMYSVDTGTYGGYLDRAISTPGVFDARVVLSGEPEMQRDWDPIRLKHVGGKVDVWVRGTIERTIKESFAFQFNTANSIRFDVIDPINLVFRARDSRLSVSNPIQEMLYNDSLNLGLRNLSNLPLTPYNLSGVIILDYRTIKLSLLVSQPPTSLDDFVTGDYRYRSNSKFYPALQPIRSITSITGTTSGVLDPDLGYTLFKLQDPLTDGESTLSRDYVEIFQNDGIPNGLPLSVNDETHVLIGYFEEPLGSVGVNTFTIAVYSKDRSIRYNGPETSNPDYLVIPGSQTTPFKIIRSTLSSIVSGSTVSVDYEHDENFSIVYVVNDVLQKVQSTYDITRHSTADVIVKQAIENPVFIEATIQLRKNANQASTDIAVRSAISDLLNRKKTGESIYQSDVTASMESVSGVDYIVQPFTRMTLKDGSVRIRDFIPSESVMIPSLSQGLNAVYILTQELPFATSNGGGPTNFFRGVFKDDIAMELAPSINDVSLGMNRAYIIGRQGAVIQGYTDDATLLSVVSSPDDVEQERLVRTANRILISLDYGLSFVDDPELHTFSATYVVSGDTEVKDLGTTGVEYLTPGDLVITYKSA